MKKLVLVLLMAFGLMVSGIAQNAFPPDTIALDTTGMVLVQGETAYGGVYFSYGNEGVVVYLIRQVTIPSGKIMLGRKPQLIVLDRKKNAVMYAAIENIYISMIDPAVRDTIKTTPVDWNSVISPPPPQTE